MGERDTIRYDGKMPNTVSSLEKDFISLGIKPGMVLIVHSSLSSLGWVCGGAPSVILALENALTVDGTLIMPAHSGDLSDPKDWRDPPVPEAWFGIIRNEMPCFDKDLTPTRSIGIIPEVFRKQKSVLRSPHPQVSFCAWGKLKEYIIQDHHFDYAQNEKSPLGRIYEKGGWILLMGVGHENNTSLHLAEYLSNYKAKKVVKNGMPVDENGKTAWREFDDIDIDSDDFREIGHDYENEKEVIIGKVGDATCRLIDQKDCVDYAVRWMEKKRS
jgi:aminoglycoside 3-N-acetyltransferase